MCKAMREGNAIYDSLQTNALLSVDEVLAIQPSLKVDADVESFVRPASEHLDTMLEVFSGRVCSGPRRAAAGIFVVTPYPLAMCCSGTSFYVFDSHAHHPYGTLLASVDLTHAQLYLEYFFAKYYPTVYFDTSSNRHLAAHLTLLKAI